MQQPHYNKDLVVRLVEEADLQQARVVVSRAFNQNAEGWFGADGTTMAGFDGEGNMVCVLGFELEELWWGSGKIPAAAIGGVSTDPKHQNKGHCGGLLVQTIHHLREQGRYLSPLWPFSFRYYGKFGWVGPNPTLVLKVWPDLVRQTGVKPGQVRQGTAEDAAQVQRLHTEGAQTRNGQSARDEAYWQKENTLKQLWVLEGEGGLDCCALVRLEDMRRGQGKRAVVREVQGGAFAAQMRLVRSLVELDGVVALNLELPIDSLFAHAFPERCDIAMPQGMDLRVLDVAQALEHLKPSEDLRATISYEVADWAVNAERPLGVTAQVEGGRVAVSQGTGSDALRCDINTFTNLFSGGLTAGQARALGRLEGGSPAAAAASDALLYGRVPYRSGVESG